MLIEAIVWSLLMVGSIFAIVSGVAAELEAGFAGVSRRRRLIVGAFTAATFVGASVVSVLVDRNHGLDSQAEAVAMLATFVSGTVLVTLTREGWA